MEPIEDELDMWGRPKRSTLRMPTEVLPEGVEADKVPLAGLILAAEGEGQQGEGQQGAEGGSGSGSSSSSKGVAVPGQAAR